MTESYVRKRVTVNSGQDSHEKYIVKKFSNEISRMTGIPIDKKSVIYNIKTITIIPRLNTQDLKRKELVDLINRYGKLNTGEDGNIFVEIDRKWCIPLWIKGVYCFWSACWLIVLFYMYKDEIEIYLILLKLWCTGSV